MTTFEYVWLVLGCGVVTYLTRMPALVMAHKMRIPPRLRRFMRFIGPSVITALIVPAVLVSGGSLSLNPLTNFFIPAALVTVITALLTKKSLPAIVAGVGAALVLSLL